MKRLSKKLGFSGQYSPQGSWTKYDARLMEGVESGDLTKVKSAMRKNGVSCVKQDLEGRTAIHVACKNGQSDAVKIMLKAEKPDLSVMDLSGKIPMHLAALSGSIDCIKYLLHRKSPVDIQDAASMTPLHYAVAGSHENAVSLLVNSASPINAKDKEGRSGLILATQNGNKNIVEMLCSVKAHLNIQDNAGRTALMYASENGMQSIVEILIAKGADLNFKDFAEKTAKSLAQSAGETEIVEILQKHLPEENAIFNGNGHNGKVELDTISEIESAVAEDSLTLNSSSSFASLRDSFSENLQRSPTGLEFGHMETSEVQKELHALKTELRNETLKRTKAEKEIRAIRMQLEEEQKFDEEAPIQFDDDDTADILSEIEKSIPSPLRGAFIEEGEDSPLVSSLRGEISALEIQIDRLKKELEDKTCSDEGKETKIPLTVYKALKESQQKITEDMQQEIINFREQLEKSREKEKKLSEENGNVIEKMNHFKEQLGKTDQSEKIRELNEKIVSLKIQLSHQQEDHENEENERLRENVENENIKKQKEIESMRSKIALVEQQYLTSSDDHKRMVSRYRNVLLSAYQGTLSVELNDVLHKISALRRCLITEL